MIRVLSLTLVVSAVAAAEAVPVAVEAQPAKAEAREEEIVLVPVRRAAPAAAGARGPWSGTVGLTVGWDSNVLLLPDDLRESTDSASPVIGVDARIAYRLLANDRGRLTLGLGGGSDTYTDEHQADLLRFGGSLAASYSLGSFDPGAVAGYQRFILDGRSTANATNGSLYVAKVFGRQVGILTLGSQHIDYLHAPDQTNTTYEAGYRHWFLYETGDIHRRLELAFKGGTSMAADQINDYTTMTPSLSLQWRQGDGQQRGTIDWAGRASYELRSYRDTDAGDGARQRILSVSVSGDAWMTEWLSVGAFAGSSRRDSDPDDLSYSRLQVGLRTTASW